MVKMGDGAFLVIFTSSMTISQVTKRGTDNQKKSANFFRFIEQEKKFKLRKTIKVNSWNLSLPFSFLNYFFFFELFSF